MPNLSRLFTKTEYTVAYRFSENGLLNDTETPFEVVKLNNKNHWYADPFIYNHNGEIYVFMEIFQNDKGYAGLGYSKLIDGKLTEPQIVIDTGYHMSFPLIFDYNGKILMMPETCAMSKIQIFECVEFPDKWVVTDCVKDNANMYDSVIFDYNNQKYLFTSEPTADTYGSNLYLMKIDESNGLHACSEQKLISSDYKISRQAGKMLESNGKLIRVAQDCDNFDYGHALEFLEIENMSVENYSEKFIKEVLPEDIKVKERVRGISGTHTYNREGNFEVIDFKLCTFSLKSTFLKIKIVFDMIKNKILKK